MIFKQLQQFRQTIYECLGTAKDATFELMDAVLTSPSIPSFVSLSESPIFRRQWSSIYGALHDSQINRAKLNRHLVSQISLDSQPLLAGDSSLWLRPEAKTLKDRGFHHHSSQGIGVGHSYSTLAWVPEGKGSWVLPLRHERITSFETALTKASFQLKQVCGQLKVRPLAVFDRHYGNSQFLKQTAKIEADLLIRLASNRCVYARPEAYSGRGAPRKHGQKFKLNDPQTHPEPELTIEVEDPSLGLVKVSLWQKLHFRTCTMREIDVIRVEIINPKGQRRKFKPLWLFWTGQARPKLDNLWRQYLRRFSLEHWYRFAKQRLFWTKPKLTAQKARERWCDLTVIMSWQLWLARLECLDTPLPWQSKQQLLSPGRVAQAFPTIIAVIGTMAKSPKTRGKSPGRQKGQFPSPHPRYPTVKKRFSRRQKSNSTPKVVT
ncbi:MAG: NF041680 family putative transposase [Cyanobacteria bacterium J06582_2]